MITCITTMVIKASSYAKFAMRDSMPIVTLLNLSDWLVPTVTTLLKKLRARSFFIYISAEISSVLITLRTRRKFLRMLHILRFPSTNSITSIESLLSISSKWT